MTTFTKAKLKKSDDQTNIEQLQIFRILYHIKINLYTKNHYFKTHDDMAFISCKNECKI